MLVAYGSPRVWLYFPRRVATTSRWASHPTGGQFCFSHRYEISSFPSANRRLDTCVCCPRLSTLTEFFGRVADRCFEMRYLTPQSPPCSSAFSLQWNVMASSTQYPALMSVCTIARQPVKMMRGILLLPLPAGESLVSA
jgi:hypothetical protein